MSSHPRFVFAVRRVFALGCILLASTGCKRDVAIRREMPVDLLQLRTNEEMQRALEQRVSIGKPAVDAKAALAEVGFRCDWPQLVDSAGRRVRPELTLCSYHLPGSDPRSWTATLEVSSDSTLRNFQVSQPDFLERYGQALRKDGQKAQLQNFLPSEAELRAAARARGVSP